MVSISLIIVMFQLQHKSSIGSFLYFGIVIDLESSLTLASFIVSDIVRERLLSFSSKQGYILRKLLW